MRHHHSQPEQKARDSAMKVRARSTDDSPAQRIDACTGESGGSTSRPGMPCDNAMAESFFSTLKLELVPDKAFA